MIRFFQTPQKSVIATEVDHQLNEQEIKELCWLYGEASTEEEQNLTGYFIGPRREMISPWSTNAVEITQNMAIEGISRIEEYWAASGEDADYDPMLQRLYHGSKQDNLYFGTPSYARLRQLLLHNLCAGSHPGYDSLFQAASLHQCSDELNHNLQSFHRFLSDIQPIARIHFLHNVSCYDLSIP